MFRTRMLWKKLGKRDDLYYINVNNIEKVSTYGKGAKYTDDLKINKKDVFILEKKVENDVASYSIKYYDEDENEELVGNLEIANPLIK